MAHVSRLRRRIQPTRVEAALATVADLLESEGCEYLGIVAVTRAGSVIELWDDAPNAGAASRLAAEAERCRDATEDGCPKRVPRWVVDSELRVYRTSLFQYTDQSFTVPATVAGRVLFHADTEAEARDFKKTRLDCG